MGREKLVGTKMMFSGLKTAEELSVQSWRQDIAKFLNTSFAKKTTANGMRMFFITQGVCLIS